ncbi:FCD domain-containing protein [Agarivorans sp. B2Z047]|uniref:GntR family transcriptional regulator n=1 Tax=Agarivorans sp. B2Z047 TaxID=2652721 RepID=UPI00128DFCAE|nr:GntR family transcriptional regulator [Agarivorans sp. B2Z047]MPW31234.1 FCD domain-containing protein [Agarivorans sp. B2Z047]UQN42801.1 GntR family transcriptional regulator [Agarivorans sp. B2Z047]
MSVTTKRQDLPLAQVAYQTLRELILNNEFKVGTQYLEKVLVERLNISRTPVREACVRLEREGLIEIQPRHGIRVKPISPDDMRDIYEILTALESQAIGTLASKGLSEQQLQRLEKATARMAESLQQDNLEAWAEADEEFHHTLLDLTDNQRLKDVVLQFWGQAHRVRFVTLHLRDTPHDSTKDHSEVVQAIRERDPIKAADIHREHRIKGGKAMVALLEKLRLANI